MTLNPNPFKQYLTMIGQLPAQTHCVREGFTRFQVEPKPTSHSAFSFPFSLRPLSSDFFLPSLYNFLNLF